MSHAEDFVDCMHPEASQRHLNGTTTHSHFSGGAEALVGLVRRYGARGKCVQPGSDTKPGSIPGAVIVLIPAREGFTPPSKSGFEPSPTARVVLHPAGDGYQIVAVLAGRRVRRREDKTHTWARSV